MFDNERVIGTERDRPLRRFQAPQRAREARRRTTVLLVEDDAEMREMLSAVLRRDGHSVVELADGDDALEWLGPGVLEGEPDRLPELIVSDIRLPYFSGLEILEGVQLGARRVPVILITGFGDEETHAKARELGAACVLDKPFDVQDLRRAISAALQRPPERPPYRAPWERDGHIV